VTVTSNLLAADNTNYAAAGWTYPNKNGFNFIVNIKCNVVALAFATGPVNFSSTEKSANVASAVFTASETTNACGYPLAYSNSDIPSWVTFDTTTR
jgi:hypothetical protein